MSKALEVMTLLGMLGLLRGGLLYGAWRWWDSRREARRLSPRALEQDPWIAIETFQRGRQVQCLQVQSGARHWVAGLYAAAGPVAWPLLTWRYGARAATWWTLPILACHTILLVLSLSQKLTVVWLGLSAPLAYFLLALRIASRDHERRVAGLQRRGWQSLGRSRVGAATPA